jgi:hypothetical protein
MAFFVRIEALICISHRLPIVPHEELILKLVFDTIIFAFDEVIHI